jgi:CRISPR-associated exonuclease Cas4
MDEDDLIPLSYLSQYYYCPRRAGLLLVDQQWADNAHTAEGTLLHERAHDGGQDRRGETLTLRGLLIRSLRLGVAGKADCVEAEPAADGVALAGRAGRWQLRPVEYKHGEQRAELEYEVQLCAQAMCLEEMLDARIVEGNLFYAGDHRRVAVALDARLRELVEVGARALHAMLAAGALPLPRKSPRCRGCSMVEVCEPRMRRSAAVHLAGLAVAAQGEPG